MPLKRDGVDEHGRPRFVRRRYDARAYTLPASWIQELRDGYKGTGARELLADYEGPFMGWVEVRKVERGGKPFVVMMRNADDQWAVELELTDGGLGEVRALPPEEAWAIARELDAKANPPIDVET